MDPDMYNAAMEGNFYKRFRSYGNFSINDHLRSVENGYEVTHNGNTILHVAALFGQYDFVGQVLKITPALLCCKNNKNETVLHIAANVGQIEVVRKLLSIEGKETLVRMTDDIGDTALHKAVRSGHIDIVRMLVKLLLDPEHDFPANKARETPLYLAAESGFHDALTKILRVFIKPTYVAGPFNRTPLHAAVIQEHTECAMALFQWDEHLCKDEWGWNSLHYAVKQGLTEIVSHMLSWNKSLAYDRAGSENKWTTAFHIAVSEGHKSMIHELLKHCPDCWDMVNINGQNALHVAILLNDDDNEAVNALFKLRICNNLVDEADNEGNTPLHLLAASGNRVPLSILCHPSSKKMTFNKLNQTPLDIASSRTSFHTWTTTKEKFIDDLRGTNARLGQRCDFDVKRQTENIRKIPKTTKDDDDQDKAKKEKLEIEKIMKSTQMHVVVATLIMTVTFAAGFTLPGGLDSDDGMAILIKNAAFGAFVISDVLAFTCSAGAIIIYFFMADSEVDVFKETKVKVFLRNYRIASALQILAMGAVVVSFVTGVYATLAKSLALAVTVCVSVIGSVSFLIYYLISTTKRR